MAGASAELVQWTTSPIEILSLTRFCVRWFYKPMPTQSNSSSTAPETPFANAAQERSPEESTEQIEHPHRKIERIRLEEITCEHPLVAKLEKLLQLPYLPQPRRECIPAGILMRILERMPLQVTRHGGDDEGFACVGNVRLYRLACISLPATEFVPAIKIAADLTNDLQQDLEKGLLVETFLAPAVFGRRKDEAEALIAAWNRAAKSGLLNFWGAGINPYGLFRERGKASSKRPVQAYE